MTALDHAPTAPGAAGTRARANRSCHEAAKTRDVPVFLFPGLSGEAREVAPLAERLAEQRGARRPVVVLTTCTPNGDGALVSTVAEMAANGVAAIRRTQPRGPYHLVGYSFGGLVAFEIARRLKLAGEDVALLGLIDAPYDQRYWPASIWLRSLGPRIIDNLRRLRTLPLGAVGPQLQHRLGRLFGRRAGRLTGAAQQTQDRAVPVSIMSASRAALERYAPPYYPGLLTLIHSDARSLFHCNLVRLWRDRAAALQVRTVSGHHLDLIRDPACLDQLVERIGGCLNALSRPTAPAHPVKDGAPRVLITTSLRWLSTARLALAFSEAGFVVDALCPGGHALNKLTFASRTHRFSALSPLSALRRTIDACAPDLIVPCDDRAARQLHQLYAGLDAGDPASQAMSALIARSLGDASQFPILQSRAQMLALSQVEGVRRPQTDGVASRDELLAWLGRFGFPAVIKTDGSWGGEGVCVVHDVDEALRAYAKLAGPPPLTRLIKRLLLDRDLNLLGPWWRRDRPNVSVQRFVAGRPANVAAACWRGEVLAITAVEAIRTAGTTGHATVVKRIDHPEMLRATVKVARRLKLSGLCGLDFMLDAEHGDAHLIEVNSRATPTCHLPGADGRSPIAALAAQLTGRTTVDSVAARSGEVVALFPHEMIRDPHSPFLRTAHHDVPWQSLPLVRLGLAFQRRKLGFAARWLRRDGKATAGIGAGANQTKPEPSMV